MNQTFQIYPKSHFINILRLEKRRAERTKLPLSIVLFYLQEGEDKEEKTNKQFVELVCKHTRETDIKGWVDNKVIGLLLPDTDKEGAKRCVEKILSRNGNRCSSVIFGNYPDHLFEKLLDEETVPDLFPINLDESHSSKRIQLIVKRTMDIVGSLFGILVFSPLMLLTAMAIKLSSPGPIIFKQYRLGMGGVRFPFYKFRSMKIDGDDRIHREYVTNLIKGELEKINQGEEGKPLYKMKDDPRITKVGRILRRTSIDELPQLFNVLKGEMSLVGPRPPIPYEVEKYQPWHLRRILEVKPGITGLWQVEGRSRTSFDDMVRLDLKYALHWSLWLDVKILLKTIKAVIQSSGAL
jgi:exopolysaccharide biosynthesis polyprenyl glycosylphosphotransferase